VPPDTKLILITLLVELGVAAAVSSSLARSNRFKNLLLADHRTRRQTLRLLAMICVPLTLGVWVRVTVPNFLAADLSLEATILLGLILGPLAGMLGRHPHFDRQILLLVLITAMQFCTSMLSRYYPRHFFELHSDSWLVELAICAAGPVVVGIPLKIWNAIRIERQLEEQGRLLLEARLDALQRQINPHFLFNTLNSITSLVRSKPELAREMIVKLANILRVLLKDREAFVPFSEELAFTDDYLDIEVVRFGSKLRVVKEIAAETLHIVVPSMLLQPLIENSIKHGLEPRIGGGTVTLRSRIVDGRLELEVEDDGVGMAPERSLPSPVSGLVRPGTGIGMRNVRERMEVLYGNEAHVSIESRPGRGTKVLLVMPILEAGAGAWSQLGMAAQAGWGAAVKSVRAVTRGADT
jgi:two-component system LytT family sensor kinase